MMMISLFAACAAMGMWGRDNDGLIKTVPSRDAGANPGTKTQRAAMPLPTRRKLKEKMRE